MISVSYSYYKIFYRDRIDPGGYVAKLALRAALACLICLAVFQFSHHITLSGWAGLAAFATVQIDVQAARLSHRIAILAAAVLTFTVLILLGLILSPQVLLFVISIPILVFICAFIACLNAVCFNIVLWGLCLYIVAGWTPTPIEQSLHIASAFFIAGLMCIGVCIFVLPLNAEKRLQISFEGIFTQLLFLLQHPAYIHQTTLEVEPLLAQLEKNLRDNSAGKMLPKQMYYISLIVKSICQMQQKIVVYPEYAQTHLDTCQALSVNFITLLMKQMKTKTQPDTAHLTRELTDHRHYLMALRRQELAKPTPDFTDYCDYSKQLYQFIKLFDLLASLSQQLAALKS